MYDMKQSKYKKLGKLLDKFSKDGVSEHIVSVCVCVGGGGGGAFSCARRCRVCVCVCVRRL